MIRLALIRHGHTAWNRLGQIQGRSDIPLDQDAADHLAQLALPEPWDKAALVSSPLLRALQTAELISGRNPVTDPALIEMDWGRWEGLRGVDLLADPTSGYKHIEEWGWSFRPPGGESPAEVRARLTPWMRSLTTDTVAVGHIGIMRVILAMASGWEFDGPPPFRVKRDRLFIVTVDGDTLQAAPDPVRLVARS